ncbi:hypothetical protein MSG28_016184 [Choristoneura fumiferana]|uniref:Uncharacterized protein n=1 Tax=Choristoneura fumiferana TaxID=7141 RepID=A0ACC0K5M1_CHOFU|nr:hypothetical protein MSG28_016184 [Choristoneura fumiferana]
MMCKSKDKCYQSIFKIWHDFDNDNVELESEPANLDNFEDTNENKQNVKENNINICDYCGKVYEESVKLMEHVLTHFSSEEAAKFKINRSLIVVVGVADLAGVRRMRGRERRLADLAAHSLGLSVVVGVADLAGVRRMRGRERRLADLAAHSLGLQRSLIVVVGVADLAGVRRMRGVSGASQTWQRTPWSQRSLIVVVGVADLAGVRRMRGRERRLADLAAHSLGLSDNIGYCKVKCKEYNIMAAKATTIKEAIKRWEDKTGQQAATATEVSLIFQWPPIEKMDNSLACLTNCEKLSLSTNLIEKAAGLNTYTNNVQPKNEAAPDLDDVSPTHFNLENAVSNMPKTETSQNSEDINITNLDNTTVSTKATQEPGFISTTHKSTPDVIASNIPKKGMMQNLKDISIRPYYTSVSYTSKQGATQNLVLVSTSHKSIPDIADSNIPKKEARQNFRDISTSLEDASGSKTSEEEATQHPEGISTSLEDANVSANNMTETEAMPNSWDISASLEDASVSNTPKAVEEPEPGDIFNTQANPQESGARNEPSLHKNAQPSLKPCYHVKKHAKEVPFVCEVCKKQFRVPWELMDHIKLASCEPLKEALMVDPPTNKILQDLVLKSCYISLERIKTENEDPNAKITITDVDICSGSEDVVDVDQQLQGSSRAQVHRRSKKLSCNSCSKKFRSHGELVAHARSHTGEKLFTCDICKKKYTYKHSLQKHIQTIHFGENCHSCKFCKEQFRSAFSLRKHVRSHTGEKEKKPYECVGDTLEELWVSYNMIEKLKGINVLRNLKVLYMSNNLELPHLEDLLFVGNPLYDACELEAWRAEAARRLPNLKKLDGETVLREDEPPLTVASMQWRLSAGFCVKVRRQWRQQYGRSPVCRRVCMRS